MLLKPHFIPYLKQFFEILWKQKPPFLGDPFFYKLFTFERSA